MSGPNQIHPVTFAAMTKTPSAIENVIYAFTRSHAEAIDRRINDLVDSFEGGWPSTQAIKANGLILHIDDLPVFNSIPTEVFTSFFIWRRLVAIGWRVEVGPTHVRSVFSKVMPIDDCPQCVRAHIASLVQHG